MSRHVIGSRSWDFILGRLASTQNLAEVPDAAILVLGVEISAVFADRKSHGVLTRPWHIDKLLVLVFDFPRQGVENVRVCSLDAVVTRPWIFVAYGADKGTSDDHPISAFSKRKAFFGTGAGVREVIGVRRRGLGGLLGKVVLVAIAEGGAPVGEGVFEFVELIATR